MVETFLKVLIEPSGVTATTKEAEEHDSSSGDESTMQWFPILKTEKKVKVLERELYFENTVLATWKESQAKELQSHQGGQKHLDRRPPEDNNNCLIFRKAQIQIRVAEIVAKASHLNLGLAPINCCDPHDR